MTTDLDALREGLAEPLARDLAREGGWQDPDAPWTENQAIIARGGAGDPVYREYLEDARALLGREALTSVLSDLAAARAEIERQAARIRFLETEMSEALDRHEAAVSQQHYLEEKLDTERQTRRALISANARADWLAAEVDALRAALVEIEACLSTSQPRPDLTEASRLLGIIVRTQRVARAAFHATGKADAPAASTQEGETR